MNIELIKKDIKDAGFGFIKVELEAELGRGGEDSRYEHCEDCDGRGNTDCEQCEGHGTLTSELRTTSGRLLDETEEIECDECYGSGEQECGYCYGEGEVERESTDFGDEDDCGRFILENVSKEAADALNYSEFYDDGSVDSEFTFTLPIEKAHLLPEFINAFSKLADAIGNEIEVEGAGMHISVLMQETNGVYPANHVDLNSRKVENFKNEVTKLLPALFIAACSGNFTRELGYRHPKVDWDKYSAINIFGSGFEYRVFETCYQRPEAIFEFLGTIARTLEYYKDTSKKVEALGKEYAWYSSYGLEGMMKTPDQVRILKNQLKHVTPKGLTVKKLTDNREIKLSVMEATKGYGKAVSRAKAMYKEHVKAYDARIKAPLTDRERASYQELQDYGYFGSDWTEEQKIARVRGISKPSQDESQFVNRNVAGASLAASVMC